MLLKYGYRFSPWSRKIKFPSQRSKYWNRPKGRFFNIHLRDLVLTQFLMPQEIKRAKGSLVP